MPLSAATRLGVYELIDAIGSGGMGEVYRARDTKLGREVAVKVVLEAFISDPERLLRFEREARSLAALNHPHIATLYGMEESDGRHFLVMELVTGRTLSETIAAGLTLDQALRFAIQIADALDAAHEKGIVHRDLKPANVKVTTDDQVKVLDFGLAKALGSDDRSSTTNIANSPTITAAGTQAGIILGTASYMSPEQARGMSGDHRSDIFSFGVVLYEMLTGRLPFQGDTVSDVLASVLARDPDLAALPPGLAPRLVDLVKRCLEKHPKRRWQAIGDVRHELETIAANPRAVASDAPPALASTSRSPWRRFAPIAGAAIVAAAATAAVFIATRTAPPTSPVSRFAVLYPEGSSRGTIRVALAISHDGSRIAYVANRELYVRALDDLEPKKLDRVVATGALSSPLNLVFSPDGKSLAYTDLGDQRLKRIDFAGGPPMVIGAAQNALALSWAGTYIYLTGPEGISRVPSSGGEPEMVIKTEPRWTATAVQLLDDGRLLFSMAPPGDESFDRWAHAKIVVQRPADAAPTTLLENASDPRYLSSGHLVYQSAGVLFARTYDPRSGALGTATPVVEGVMRGATPTTAGQAWYRASDTGTLVYVPGPMGDTVADRRLAWFDRTGTTTFLPIPAGPYQNPRVSRDGKRVAFSRSEGPDTAIWVYDVATGGSARRLTFGGHDRYPVWSSDSQWIFFQSNRGGDNGIYRQRVDGTGQAERLTTAEKGSAHIPQSVAPDESALLFTDVTAGNYVLMTYSFRGRSSSPYPGISARVTMGGDFSPDGKWVAYSAIEGGVLIPYVQPYPATGPKYQITSARDGGHTPVWSADGRELFFTPGPGGTLSAVKVTTSPSFSFGPGEAVTRNFMNAPPSGARMFDVVGPGLRFLGMIPTDAASAPAREEIRVVVNWTAELKSRVK